MIFCCDAYSQLYKAKALIVTNNTQKYIDEFLGFVLVDW